MRAVDLIHKKRNNHSLSQEEVHFLLNEYKEGNIPDYQMSAFLMATFFNGMKIDELKIFTKEMINSGDTVDFPEIDKFLLDKHSTGGVGDKTTIILAPILAALNIGTAKLSGKGLGHTGGTIDKFESIPGFKFSETRESLIDLVNDTGIGIMGYSDTIVPLDKKLYSLRDVTATVACIPLISSSIMSKKLAVHSDAIILDVKVGSGAFMKDIKSATELAKTMFNLGKAFDRKIICLITNMDQPLGRSIGNSLEVIEAIETLKGNGPEDVTMLIKNIVSHALMMKGEIFSLDEGMKKVDKILSSKVAVKKLEDFIKASGGNPNICHDYSLLPIAQNTYKYISKKAGTITHINAEKIGVASMKLGAGRAIKGDLINHGVGIVLEKKVGDKVTKDDVLLNIYYDEGLNNEILQTLDSAIVIEDKYIDKPDVIIDIIKD